MDFTTLQPIYPRVLVRRLPRTQQVGSIFLPDDISKPMHEGVVLRVWKPFHKEIGHLKLSVEDEQKLTEIAAQKTCAEEPDGEPGDEKLCMTCRGIMGARLLMQNRKQYVEMKSQLSEGDVIVFPHYEGTEVPNDDTLLTVNEFQVALKIDPDAVAIREQFDAFMHKIANDSTVDSAVKASDRIHENFIIVPKQSFTRSGKSINGVY